MKEKEERRKLPKMRHKPPLLVAAMQALNPSDEREKGQPPKIRRRPRFQAIRERKPSTPPMRERRAQAFSPKITRERSDEVSVSPTERDEGLDQMMAHSRSQEETACCLHTECPRVRRDERPRAWRANITGVEPVQSG
jgi:hypothetical protein